MPGGVGRASVRVQRPRTLLVDRSCSTPLSSRLVRVGTTEIDRTRRPTRRLVERRTRPSIADHSPTTASTHPLDLLRTRSPPRRASKTRTTSPAESVQPGAGFPCVLPVRLCLLRVNFALTDGPGVAGGKSGGKTRSRKSRRTNSAVSTSSFKSTATADNW
jgi:hypothetical protein